MGSFIKKTGSVIAVLLLFSSFTYAQGDETYRIAGENRYETAAKIAMENYENGVDAVILARGDSIAGEPQITDALASSVLAKSLEAPILLTGKDRMPKATKKALQQFDPSVLYVIGGENAITEETLENININTKRVAGENRYETAMAIAKKGATGSTTAFLVRGDSGADALAIGSVAHKKGHPILLSGKDQLPDVTKEGFMDLGIEEVVIIGGENAISKEVKAELQEIKDLKIRRIAGKNREKSSIAIAKEYWEAQPSVLVNGHSLVDAVGASTLEQPIIFVSQNRVIEAVRVHINRAPGLVIAGGKGAISSGVIEEIYREPDYEAIKEKAGYLTNDHEGNVLGVQRGSRLVRLEDRGNRTKTLYQFPDPIRAIHVMEDGNYIVATDRDHWDPGQPSRVYLSKDKGKSFQLIKEMNTGSALWWSIDSDSLGNVYVGEYGERSPGNAKRVWKTEDLGGNWEVVFQAPNKDGIHIHLVAVDPYTDDLWVTYGDDYEGMYRSKDQGSSWEWIREAQSTAVIFTEDSIYWGEDTYRGVVTKYHREKGTFEEVLSARGEGFYGGSIYDMAIGKNGLIYVPMLKYRYNNHNPTLWVGSGNQWTVVKEIKLKEGVGGGFPHITNPDKNGDIFVRGFRFKDVK